MSEGPDTPAPREPTMTRPPAPSSTVPPSVAASLQWRHAHQQRLLAVFLFVSLVIHTGALAAYAFWPAPHKPALNLDDAIVKTRLVRLGKTRDEKLLPRLPTSPPPPSSDQRAPPTDKPAPDKPAPDSSKKASANDILDKFEKANAKPTDVRDLIRDRIGEQTDEGREDGDQEGTDLTGEIKATWFTRVALAVQKNLEVSSTLSDEERVRLRCELALKLDDEGNLVDVKIQKSSGNATFDNDVLAAAKRSSPLPAPPPPVQTLAASGFAFNVCPSRCQ